MNHIRNVKLSEYLRFLELVGCKCIKNTKGHYKYSRHDLTRPIVIQTHIDPVPEFIIANGLKELSISKDDFWPILRGEKAYTPPPKLK